MAMMTDMSILKDDQALCCLSACNIITITHRFLYLVSVANFTADLSASNVLSTTVHKNTSKYGHP